MKDRLILRVLMLVCVLVSSSAKSHSTDDLIMMGYSSEPLAEPVFDYTYTMVDSATFNNWLNANYKNLDQKSMKGPREYLYYLISSYISDLHSKTGKILPDEPDLVLESLFAWSEKLGVYGANQFYNKVKRRSAPPIAPLVLPPEGIRITTMHDMYRIEAEHGNWTLLFPYYFMIGEIKQFVAKDGTPVQLLIISTGASKDKSEPGRSQATLMFVYSPPGSEKKFKKFWTEQFAAKENQPRQLGESSSLYVYQEDALMHKELYFQSTPSGNYLTAYLGVDGTYQHNRQHFLDFVKKINVK
ncbi:hypothetical protein FE810_12645 [Thalassotalea litorea]|uniref:Uncharacterized protein n=1 Tax=Thalassotalea litorea TaxID=2020715 RepID=A0A5R9IF52_9GAMM|nr:hypothetical protein [Thalassotalea litorea]TLU64150.1 hypothetical protein FE810_12645 [Thalassotalea litorea]